MKRRLLLSLSLIALMPFLTDCEKYKKSFDTFFYTDVENASGPVMLYIDGEVKGTLPNLHTRVSPDNDTIKNNALYLRLKSGKYRFEVKDEQGNLKVKGTFTYHKNSNGESVSMGGQASASSGGVFVTEFTF